MNRLFRYLLVFMSAVLLSACASGSQQRSHGPAPSSESDTAEVEAVKKKLNEAFEQIRQGKKNVTVDLNEDPDIVQKGDLAHAHYTASLEDGTLIHTTHSEVARGASKKAVGYEEPKSFVPEDVLVGAEPGVRGLGDALVGMAVGEQKRVTVPPEKAYGPRDPDKVVDFPRVAKRPKMVELPPDEYLGRYGKFPVQGAEVSYDAYFNAIVLDVTEDHATLSMFPVEEGPIQDTFGTTVVTEAEEEMEVTLTPKIGGAFRLKDQDGRVVASDSENFTVDFNHPLAGENVVFEVELLSLTKASAWRDTQIPWMEDYEEAIAAAGRGDKPILLVLYADWCGFSKKLFDRTMEDPRIKVLKDRFVWLKIDSSKDCSYKNRFGQEGYPMIVVMDPEGLVLEKMNGYRDGKTLREGLEEYLGQTERG